MKDRIKYFLEPGHIFISREPYLIATVLGSCVSVCVWDIHGSIGGMNHFMLPENKGKERKAIYGDVATEYLIRSMIRNGVKREDIKAHIIGGGYNVELGSSIGESNVRLAERILRQHNVAIVNKDTGECTGRKLVFDNKSGEIIINKNIVVRKADWYGTNDEKD